MARLTRPELKTAEQSSRAKAAPGESPASVVVIRAVRWFVSILFTAGYQA